jgi:hypothetical protein
MNSNNLKVPPIAIGTVLNTNITSSAIPLQYMLTYAIQVVWTGTATGTFTLNASADPAAQANATGSSPISLYAPVDWTQVASSSLSPTGVQNVMWNFGNANCGYNWVQIVYTDSSGGTSTAVITKCNVSLKGG